MTLPATNFVPVKNTRYFEIPMFIWQYVDLDPDEVDRIQRSFIKATLTTINFNFFQPLKIDTNEFMGMKIKNPVLIQAAPFKSGQVHIDVRLDSNVLALQIPLVNCENSVTEFWEEKITEETQPWIDGRDGGSPYKHISREYCKKIDEFVLTKPIVFRTDIPHSVTNKSKNFRKAISLRFYDDPWHLLNNGNDRVDTV